jgi:hypothetical protein
MILKSILFFIGLFVIILLFYLQNVFSKPIYNKMSNVWEDDTEGRLISQIMIVSMCIISFLLGIFLS